MNVIIHLSIYIKAGIHGSTFVEQQVDCAMNAIIFSVKHYFTDILQEIYKNSFVAQQKMTPYMLALTVECPVKHVFWVRILVRSIFWGFEVNFFPLHPFFFFLLSRECNSIEGCCLCCSINFYSWDVLF